MRRPLLVLCVAMAGGLAVACDDTARTAQPVFLTAGTGGGGGLGGGPVGGAAGAGTGGVVAATGGSVGAAGTGGWTGSGAGRGGAAGAAGAAGTPIVAPPAPVGLVSVNSDYSTTSVSLLNPAGGVLVPDCVVSSPVQDTSTLTLSGDVVLPSQPQRGGYLVLIDRSNGWLTLVNTTPSAGVPCVVHAEIPIPGGDKVNPHDVVIVSDNRAYVTRYNANPTASSPQLAGNDVVVIDPSNNGAFISRISLDGYASTAAGGPVLARPDRALIADGLIVVSLNQASATFAPDGYGDGAVVLIDPATNAVAASIPLPGLYNCEGMDYIASSHRLLVACGGGYAPPIQPLQSGIAVIDLGATPPRLDHVISSIAFDGRPLDFGWVLADATPSSPTRAFAATRDPRFTGPDALFQFDLEFGAVAPVAPVATGPASALGTPAVSDLTLFVPEAIAGAPKIQLFDLTAPVTVSPQPISAFNPDRGGSLPPRQIGWY